MKIFLERHTGIQIQHLKKNYERKNNDGEEAPIEARLFEMPRQRRKENWLCVKLIAGEEIKKKKKYTSAYCTLCKKRIAWSHSNPSNVSRHMISKHKDVINKYEDEHK